MTLDFRYAHWNHGPKFVQNVPLNFPLFDAETKGFKNLFEDVEYLKKKLPFATVPKWYAITLLADIFEVIKHF